MAKSLNKVMLIGNLTRDPEMKYTPAGTAVCTFTIATNRSWSTDTGDKKDVADFHKIVAWNKLAEICAQLLKKGRKVYVEGRIQTRSWQDKDGQTKYMTEIVISDMLLLDNKMDGAGEINIPEKEMTEGVKNDDEVPSEEVNAPAESDSDDIPF